MLTITKTACAGTLRATSISFLLLTLSLPSCDNGAAARAEAEKAGVEAEKAKAELAKVKVEAELAKVKAEAEAELAKVKAEAELAKTKAEATVVQANARKAVQEASAPIAQKVVATVIVNVQERKSDGNPWDALGGAPDIRVTLSGPNSAVESAIAQDRFVGTFQLPVLELTPGTPVNIIVIDVDAMQSDPIGSGVVTYSGPGTSASGEGGSMTFSVEFAAP